MTVFYDSFVLDLNGFRWEITFPGEPINFMNIQTERELAKAQERLKTYLQLKSQLEDMSRRYKEYLEAK